MPSTVAPQYLFLLRRFLAASLPCARAGLLAHARSLLARICRLSRSHFGCRSVQTTYLTKSGDSSGQRWRLTATTLLTAHLNSWAHFAPCSGPPAYHLPMFSSTKQVPRSSVQPKNSCLLASKKKKSLLVHILCSHRMQMQMSCKPSIYNFFPFKRTPKNVKESRNRLIKAYLLEEGRSCEMKTTVRVRAAGICCSPPVSLPTAAP